uniref:Uncharacterized protein n=1 Tax=Opuntia streptacantha TaxID=393608 RepID=A0A7C8ZUU6_OPUST
MDTIVADIHLTCAESSIMTYVWAYKLIILEVMFPKHWPVTIHNIAGDSILVRNLLYEEGHIRAYRFIVLHFFAIVQGNRELCMWQPYNKITRPKKKEKKKRGRYSWMRLTVLVLPLW